MNNNFYSLLNSNWMFANNSEASLYPFLFKLINGNSDLSVDKLPETVFSFIQSNGISTSTPSEKGTVAIIKMHHPIFKYDQNCGPKGTQSIMKMMDSWKDDNSIKGVLLDKNTGGGQASGCSEFSEYLHNYPKPTVTYTKDIIGSAGYYSASGTDFIIADKHADFIGCIGSMVRKVNIEGILIKKGATIEEFYADISPEKNLQSRELKKGNSKPLIEKFLNPAAQKFQNDVKLYRPQISEKALKGDVFTPEEALKEGLIDEIGTLQTAIDKVFELSKATNNNSLNNTNQTAMARLNVPNLEAIIGAEFSQGDTETGVLLTDEQALAIETQLQENATALETADSNATALQTANTEATALTTSIQDALAEAGVENATELSNQDGITALSALITEYGAKDGAGTTQTIASTDETFTGDATQKLKSTIENL